MKAQAAKRDGNPNHKSIGADLGTRIPERVPGIVGALAFGPECVGLNTLWIYIKDEAVALVLKSVQRDFYIIVRVKRTTITVGDRRFASGQAGADAVRLVPAQEHDVDFRLVVAEISL